MDLDEHLQTKNPPLLPSSLPPVPPVPPVPAVPAVPASSFLSMSVLPPRSTGIPPSESPLDDANDRLTRWERSEVDPYGRAVSRRTRGEEEEENREHETRLETGVSPRESRRNDEARRSDIEGRVEVDFGGDEDRDANRASLGWSSRRGGAEDTVMSLTSSSFVSSLSSSSSSSVAPSSLVTTIASSISSLPSVNDSENEHMHEEHSNFWQWLELLSRHGHIPALHSIPLLDSNTSVDLYKMWKTSKHFGGFIQVHMCGLWYAIADAVLPKYISLVSDRLLSCVLHSRTVADAYVRFVLPFEVIQQTGDWIHALTSKEIKFPHPITEIIEQMYRSKTIDSQHIRDPTLRRQVLPMEEALELPGPDSLDFYSIDQLFKEMNRETEWEEASLHAVKEILEANWFSDGRYILTISEDMWIRLRIPLVIGIYIQWKIRQHFRIPITSPMDVAIATAKGERSFHSKSNTSSSSSDSDGKKRISADKIRVLEDWLEQNRQNPYPSSDAKRLLSQRTGLNLSQINNWFNNARKRKLRFKDDPSEQAPRSLDENPKPKYSIQFDPEEQQNSLKFYRSSSRKS